MLDNKFWMNVLAVIVAMLLMSWVVRPVLGNVLGLSVKEGNSYWVNGGCRVGHTWLSKNIKNQLK